MAFPQTPLDVRTELQIGGTWTIVTGDVYTRNPLSIEAGRSEEGVRTNPSKLSLELNNRLGKYSPRNPMSPYYGLIGRNTPVRVSTALADSHLLMDGTATGQASTPDHASLDITGDLDLRIEATTVWSAPDVQMLLGKYEPSGNQRSYLLYLDAGLITLRFSPDGVNSAFARLAMPDVPRRAAVRATLDADNGAGGWTASFYWAESLDGPWNLIGSATAPGGTATVFASTAPLQIAPAPFPSTTPPWLPMDGRVHRAEVRNGINGTIVAAPDFRPLAEGTTSFADSAGRTWTTAGTAQITNREYLFHGEISAWPARWDVSGKDVWVPVEAAGIQRRLGQGKKALDSTLRRRVPAFGPLAYWPCEEQDGASQAYSPVDGVAPATVAGFRFAQDDTLGGSSALPSVEAGGTFTGTVPPPLGASTGWSVHMVYSVDSAPGTDAEFLSWLSNGTVRRWQIQQASGIARIRGYDEDDNAIVSHNIVIGIDVFAGWQRLQFRAEQIGGSVDYRIDWYNIGGAAGGLSGSVAGTTGRVTQVKTVFGAITGLNVGHVTVLPVGDAAGAAAPFFKADHGYSGESALDRLRRLANEESGTVSLTTSDGDLSRPSETMGPQRPDTLLDLFQECAEADGGILYETRDRIGLRYRDRTTLYNQTPALVLDYTAKGEVAPPLEPVEDDQKTRNDVTITRRGGSSGRAVLEEGPLSVQAPPDGVGLYDESVTLNLANDFQPPRIAGWRLHLGTVDEARYPTVRLMLHAVPHLIPDFLALVVGDRIQILNPPQWLPPGPIDLIVQGYSMVLDQFTWDVALNCTPAAPWTVGVVGDPARGKADTAGSELTAAVSSSAMALVVLATQGQTWTRDPAQVPWDATLGGETVTATAVTGAAEDDFSAAVSSGWGTADVGGAWSTGGGSATDYNVTSGRGTHTLTSANVSRRTILAWTVPDVDVQADIQTSALATGAALTGGLTARYIGADDLYTARLAFGTAQTITLTIRKRVAGTETELGTYTVPLTHAANSDVRLRFRVFGDQLAAKAWATASPEPRDWQLVVTDTSHTTSSSIGCRSISLTSNTNASPLIRYDNFVILNPTRWTVARSANGIVKAHAAGTNVRLAHPMRAAL